MATAILFEERLRIPGIASLAEFRTWLRTGDFPEKGRIDYIGGQIEVDMSPEDIFAHGSVKTQVAMAINARVIALDSGMVLIDSSRVTCPDVALSVEPDVVVVSHQSVKDGIVKLVPKAADASDRFIEIEGPPQLIVEIVSDSSVGKDTKRLPEKYFRAGVEELWLIDARKKPAKFIIHHRGKRSFVTVSADRTGFARSAVLNARYRLVLGRDGMGWPRYELQQRK
jgi:Uma2 family endonuclease